jgi:hypothetical protein
VLARKDGGETVRQSEEGREWGRMEGGREEKEREYSGEGEGCGLLWRSGW